MPIKVLMPALSPTMKEGNLAKWHVKEGDNVSAGDLIAEIETDKATMEVEAVDEGVVGKVLVDAGTKNVKVNSVIAVLLEDGEEKSAIDSMDLSSEEEASKEKPEEKEEAKESPAPKAPKPLAQPTQIEKSATSNISDRIFASPLAKRIAAEKNLNISKIRGTGPKGRVVKDDVLNHKGTNFGFSNGQVQRVQPEESALPISTMRQVIADRLVESKQNVPHFYLSVDCRMDKLLEMRKDLNALADKESPEFKISVNDMVIKASALALRDVPEANTSWSEGAIIQYNNVDISVAVAIEGGLITPIVRNADQKSLIDISGEMKQLVKKAKSGTLSPEEFQGGGFSISNLGMFGIKQFNAIINPPQSCILAVGTTTETPIVVDGELEVANMMTLTISCDHRVVDGAVGASLLNRLKNAIENPVRMLV